MNSVHDCGGMDGMGPIAPEPNEPYFHHDWERTVMSMFIATFAAGCYNVDEFRHAIERMPPAHYLSSTYYEHWLEAMWTLLAEKGFVTREELARGRAAGPAGAPMQKLPQEMVAPLVKTGASCKVEVDAPRRFSAGQKVRARNINPAQHTRLPRYVRGRVGVIDSDHGVFVFPDASAHGGGPPQRLYNVRFSARELWGEERSDKDSLVISMFDRYLDPA